MTFFSHRSLLGIVVRMDSVPNRGADANKPRTIIVRKLQSYVIDQVRKLTEGGQNRPSAGRAENTTLLCIDRNYVPVIEPFPEPADTRVDGGL